MFYNKNVFVDNCQNYTVNIAIKIEPLFITSF